MNTTPDAPRTGTFRLLAILGFIAAVIAGLWLIIQAVRYLPTGFVSLANMADGLFGRDKGLALTAPQDVVTTGDSFRINFNPIRQDGVYVFSYRCIEGVSAQTRDADGDIVDVACDENIEIRAGRVSGVQTHEVTFESEKQRFSDIPYTISFYEDDADSPLYESKGIATIINPTIPEAGVATGVKPTTKPATDPKPTNSTDTKPTTPVASPMTQPTATTRVPVETITYQESNPNGTADLEVRIIGVGEMNGTALIPKSTLDADNASALQVAIKNIGTKTSHEWDLSISYPGDEDNSYTSRSRKALLPGEREIITLRFTPDDTKNTERIRVTVTSKAEKTTTNNTAVKAIQIKD
jgi:hypothetical protein